MPNGDYAPRHRPDDPNECLERHMRWQKDWWREVGMPKTKNLIIGGITALIVALASITITVTSYMTDSKIAAQAASKEEFNKHKDSLAISMARFEEKMDTVKDQISDLSKEVVKVQVKIEDHDE